MFNFFNKKTFDRGAEQAFNPADVKSQMPGQKLGANDLTNSSNSGLKYSESLGSEQNAKVDSDNLKSLNLSDKSTVSSGFNDSLSPFSDFGPASAAQSNNVFSNFNKSSTTRENQNLNAFNSFGLFGSQAKLGNQTSEAWKPVIKPSESNNNTSAARGVKNRGPFKQNANSENFNSKASKATKSKIKDKVVSITYEEIGLFPRSFSRVFDRFLKQIFSDVENLVIQEYRFYRYLFLTTIQTIFILIFVPLVVNFIAKTYLIRPITEYFWNTKQTEIFLNSYEQKRAFIELQDFEEKLYFESLLISNNFISSASVKQEQLAFPPSTLSTTSFPSAARDQKMETSLGLGKQQSNININLLSSNPTPQNLGTSEQQNLAWSQLSNSPELAKESQKTDNFLEKSNIDLPMAFNSAFNSGVKGLEQSSKTLTPQVESHFTSQMNVVPGGEETLNAVNLSLPQIKNATGVGLISVNKNSLNSGTNQYYLNQSSLFLALADSLQEKTLELAIRYNNHSIESITNFFADFLSLMTLLYLLISLEIQINITKSFLLEVFFGLDDSKKSLLILIMTDLLVGYHSSNLWELFFQFIFNHYGIPESQTGIFLLVATLPVLLDVLFKYLIFRHLNRSSPATVATYHAIIE